jgi:uncharacterized protein YdaT
MLLIVRSHAAMDPSSLSAEDRAKAEHRRHVQKKNEQEQAKHAAELKEKLEERREQRRIDAKLKRTKALGTATSERDDDLLVRSASRISKDV